MPKSKFIGQSTNVTIVISLNDRNRKRMGRSERVAVPVRAEEEDDDGERRRGRRKLQIKRSKIITNCRNHSSKLSGSCSFDENCMKKPVLGALLILSLIHI